MLPGSTVVPIEAAVNLKVFVPVLNNGDGFGVTLAFLKKNAPKQSPQLSENNPAFVTVADAPLVRPMSVNPSDI